jgi:hypothetical protein
MPSTTWIFSSAGTSRLGDDVKHTIDQFMWGYQQHFRMSLEHLAESCFKDIGLDLDPRAYLVGFKADDDAHFPICVEPEDGPISQSDLAGVDDRTAWLYDHHEDRDTIHSDPGMHERYHAWIVDDCRGEAIAEALVAAPGGAGRRFFAGPGMVIDHYRVYPVLGVDAATWDKLPSLTTVRRNRIYTSRSLQEAVMTKVLRAASTELARKEPPSTMLTDSRSDATGIVRTAADSLVYGVGVMAGEIMAYGLRESLDTLSAQPYEGRASVGSLLLAKPGHPDVDVEIAFDNPVDIRNARAFRKVLEMSGPDLRLLCDGQQIFGMGSLRETYDAAKEECFAAMVVGRGSWQLDHAGVPLVRIDNGAAHLPRERLSKLKFVDTFERLFPTAPAGSADAVWGTASACSEQAHGTKLVVHPDAAEEGRRLAPQALTISPERLKGSTLAAMTAIDGAVLVSPDGLCHAVGVILDGAATGTGDPARGARFNSAVRYIAGAGEGSLVIIVSEDGMIDLLPYLQPRVSRAAVQAAVDAVLAASTPPINFETFHRLEDEVRALAFYLAQTQCEALNEARERVETYRMEVSQMRVGRLPLQSDPAMDDSYFL